jgi:hypothetical protein
MLIIGSSEEYLESPWVKSEWKRWLHLKREEDMYVCVLHNNNESPFDILPQEISELEPQIYTQNNYKRLIEHICCGVGTDNEVFVEDNYAVKREEAHKAEEIPSDIYSDKAEEYYKKALDGDAISQFNLGYCYDIGRGVAQDYSKAVYWYTKSAEQGNKDAQNNLGACYKNGRGVAQDYSKAVYWYTKAADQGHQGAKATLARLK